MQVVFPRTPCQLDTDRFGLFVLIAVSAMQITSISVIEMRHSGTNDHTVRTSQRGIKLNNRPFLPGFLRNTRIVIRYDQPTMESSGWLTAFAAERRSPTDKHEHDGETTVRQVFSHSPRQQRQ